MILRTGMREVGRGACGGPLRVYRMRAVPPKCGALGVRMEYVAWLAT